MGLTSFVERKLKIADALSRGECGGTYSEATLIMAALVSGIAADLWPGKRIDRRRFVELWTRDADPVLTPRLISLPLLTHGLRSSGRVAEAKALEDAKPQMFGPGYYTRILSGGEVDMDEGEVVGVCPGLQLREIREFAYPNVFYEEVRCAMSHEYRLGTAATSHPMDEDEDQVSYANRQPRHGEPPRLIHFHVPWIMAIVRSVAASSEAEIDSDAVRQPPQRWWTDG